MHVSRGTMIYAGPLTDKDYMPYPCAAHLAEERVFRHHTHTQDSSLGYTIHIQEGHHRISKSAVKS